MYMELLAMVPAILAVLSLGFITPTTRGYCYAIVVLALGAELMPLQVNLLTLAICVACLVALLVHELLTWFYHPTATKAV